MEQTALTIVSLALSAIETLVPYLTKGATTDQINSVITFLEKLLPVIGNAISPLYQAIKNIIGALSANPDTLADQLAALQALDKQADDAFEPAAADTDAGK